MPPLLLRRLCVAGAASLRRGYAGAPPVAAGGRGGRAGGVSLYSPDGRVRIAVRAPPRYWTEGEDGVLRRVLREHPGGVEAADCWEAVSEELPGRSSKNCRERWTVCLDPGIVKGKWTKEEDRSLSLLVGQLGNRWAAIAREIPGRTGTSCRTRWTRSLDPDIVKGGWRAEEDEALGRFMEKHGDIWELGDWEAASLEVPGRTATRCRERWTEVLDPEIVNGTWTAEEDDTIRRFVGKHGKMEELGAWVAASRELPGRTGVSCRRRWTISLNHEIEALKGKWTAEEDETLRSFVRKNGKEWGAAARKLPGMTATGCRNRWTMSLDPEIAKGKWTAEQDEALRCFVLKNGRKWAAAARGLQPPGRTDASCKDRWTESLDPEIVKMKWTVAEDETLRRFVHKNGKRWAAAARELPGRTANRCRDRWVRYLDTEIV